MKKLLFVLFLFWSFFLTSPSSIFADENFISTMQVSYHINTSGITHVVHTISLENRNSSIYATSYQLSLNNMHPQNIKAETHGTILEVEPTFKDQEVTATVKFPDALVGLGTTRVFTITYDSREIAKQNGEVWELVIPKLSSQNSFINYQVELQVPTALGTKAYLSPEAASTIKSPSQTIYLFNQGTNLQNGIVGSFGDFQIFDFNLSYHLQNPINTTSTTEIALPPDTAFQKVHYQNLVPAPDQVTIDPDGNWLAQYTLKPKDRFDVKAQGFVQIYAKPQYTQTLAPHESDIDLKPTQYWQTQDPKIQGLTTKLNTPKAIYDFVSQTLHYDFNRVTPNVERFGALKALKNPANAICMEYTDLFVALSRSAGIPAREINGFAYTENPDIQPLSLVSDVLHAWPEYYDSAKKVWVPIDPTWGSTTGGLDFFSKLDLRHFTFVIHGQSSTYPYPAGSYKLGASPQKDVFVNFGHGVSETATPPQISIDTQKVSIKNTNTIALDTTDITIKFDDKPIVKQERLQTLPPYAHQDLPLTLDYGFLGLSLPTTIQVEVLGTSSSYTLPKTTIVAKNFAVLLTLTIICILLLKLVHARIKHRSS